jgi:hypothetical protein
MVQAATLDGHDPKPQRATSGSTPDIIARAFLAAATAVTTSSNGLTKSPSTNYTNYSTLCSSPGMAQYRCYRLDHLPMRTSSH